MIAKIEHQHREPGLVKRPGRFQQVYIDVAQWGNPLVPGDEAVAVEWKGVGENSVFLGRVYDRLPVRA
jgi:hypothetical protein